MFLDSPTGHLWFLDGHGKSPINQSHLTHNAHGFFCRAWRRCIVLGRMALQRYHHLVSR